MKAWRAGAALTCAGLALGCRPAPAPPNVLVVVIDALRATRLGVYGAQRPTSPALDAFAKEATVFDRAYSTAPWTKPSVASILTGLYPEGHGLHGMRRKLGGSPKLPELLARRGYATAGIVANPLLSAEAGFSQGFQTYLEDQALGAAYVSTEGVTREASAAVEAFAKKRAPFFLYVHYFDPHADYRRHRDVGFAPDSAGRLRGDEPQATIRDLTPSMTPAEVEYVRAAYDEEVRHTDTGVGALLDRLRELGLWSSTLVIVTADHGEELRDRGFFGHTRSLYDELVRVPLLVKPPGEAPARRVATPVSLAALAPTVLDFAGGGAGGARFDAASLAGALRSGGEVAAGDVLVEVDFLPVDPDDPVGEVHKKALVQERLKVIRDDRSGQVEMYDLLNDPAETLDLAAQGMSVRRPIARLERLLRAVRRPADAGKDQTFTPEEIERLRSLGYVGGH